MQLDEAVLFPFLKLKNMMKKTVFYALCMSAGLLCLPLVSCGDDEKDELTEVIGGGSADDDATGNENNNQGDEAGGDNDNGGGNGENGDNPDNPDNPGDNTGGGDDEPIPDSKKHKAVDLGLSVKWATCNVGASSPEDFGGYYAWGETEEKSYYDWSTYKYCKDSYTTMTKYCTDSSYGSVDNKTVLTPEDDVAHVKWGGSWRMPTSGEIGELINNCSWTWTVQNGVNGYLVTSKSNGNSIFLPAAGNRWDENVYYSGSNGIYWSASLYEDGSNSAYYLYFYSGGRNQSNSGRYTGFSVRPVTE